MNNALDELAGLLFTTDNSKSVSPWSEWERCKDDPRLAGYVYALADALIQAGYRRPRTITTAEELDALPGRSVVLTSAGTIANLVGDAAYFFGYDTSVPRSVLALPATVLYEPGQP